MDQQAATATPEVQAPESNYPPSSYPALSISKPPPRSQTLMNLVLWGLFGGAVLLGVAGVVMHMLGSS